MIEYEPLKHEEKHILSFALTWKNHEISVMIRRIHFKLFLVLVNLP